MSTITIVGLRVRAALPVLLSLALIVVVAVIALGTTAGLIQHGVATGATSTLQNAAAQSSAVRITTHLADDSTTQAAAATALFDSQLPPGTVTITSSTRSLPVPVRGDPSGATAVFARVPDLADRVQVTAGSWPAETSGAAPVAVQADAAAALGLNVGDQFSVGTDTAQVDLRVAALWRATDPTASAWFADSAAAAGSSGGAAGLFVVEDAFTALPTQLFAVWTLSATPAAASDTNRTALIHGLARLTDVLDATPDVTDASSTVEGDLAGTLHRIEDASRGATAIGVSATFIVGMLTIVALLQVSTVLVGSRSESTALLRARGLSRSQGVLLAATEGLLVAVPAGVLGVAATAAVLAVATGGDPLGRAASVAPYAVGVGLVSVVVLTATTLGDASASAGRRPLSGFAIAFGVIGVAAVLATWQLHAQGSPVTGSGADLVTAASPALALIAASALGTAAFITFAAALAARSARTGSTIALLADRELGQRAAAHLVPILAVAITVASAFFATGIAATWQSAQLEAHLVGTGPDLGIALRSDSTANADTEPVEATGYAALDGVRGASAALVTRVRVGADSIPFVSLRPDAASSLLGASGDPLAAALRGTSPTSSGLALPETATGVEATVSFGAAVPEATFAVSAWVADADGSLARIPLTAVNADSATGSRAGAVRAGTLPAGTSPWRMLAVESERIGTPDSAVPTLLAGGFASTADGVATALDPGAEVSLDVAAALPRSRALITANDPAAPLPVVVTRALAGRADLVVGDALDVGFGTSGATVTARVASIIEILPGAASRLGIATDLAALNNATLQPGRVPQLAGNLWLDTGGDPTTTDSVAVAASRVAGSTAVISSARTETSAPMLEPAINAFWIAAAAAGLLALITLAAFITDDARSRRSALPVLRALGLSAAEQTAVRGRGLLIPLGFAVLVGIVAGLLATTAAVAPFVAAAIPGAGGYVSVAPAFDLLRWLLFSVVVVAGALLVIGVSLRRLHRGLRQAAVPAVRQHHGQPNPARTDPAVIS
jgi:hypothetical protein